MTAPVQYGFLLCSLYMLQDKEQKPSTWPFLAYQEIEKSSKLEK